VISTFWLRQVFVGAGYTDPSLNGAWFVQVCGQDRLEDVPDILIGSRSCRTFFTVLCDLAPRIALRESSLSGAAQLAAAKVMA
jgi:hypothetical protein